MTNFLFARKVLAPRASTICHLSQISGLAANSVLLVDFKLRSNAEGLWHIRNMWMFLSCYLRAKGWFNVVFYAGILKPRQPAAVPPDRASAVQILTSLMAMSLVFRRIT